MSVKWITSDWHLGETRFTAMQRPFTDQEQMIRHLVAQHNALVKPHDIVYVNGDVCYDKHPEFLRYVDAFNGWKVLIRGNHDRVISDKEFSLYFNEIIPEGEGIEVDIDGIPCYITHYPTCGRIDRFNLVGHVHAAWKYQLNMLNIGIDANHFRPMNFDQVPHFLKSIETYYDDDAWAAYLPCNSNFLGQRGKKGSRLDDMIKML